MVEHEYVMVVHPKDKERVEKAVKEFAKDKKIEVRAHQYAQSNSIIFLRKDMISPLEPEETDYFHDFFQKAFGEGEK